MTEANTAFLQNPAMDANRPLVKIGVYGWRKQCLYVLVMILAASVVINFALMIWLMLLLKPSFSGFGPLTITDDGVVINGTTDVRDTLYVNHIVNRPDARSINIEANQELTISAGLARSKSTPTLRLTQDGSTYMGKRFYVNDVRGRRVLSIDDRKIEAVNAKLMLSSMIGLRTIETDSIQSSTRRLELQSGRYGSMVFKSPRSIILDNSELVHLVGSNMTLSSSKRINIITKNIHVPHLPTFGNIRGQFSPSYDSIDTLHVCSCPNGKLFAATACRSTLEWCGMA